MIRIKRFGAAIVAALALAAFANAATASASWFFAGEYPAKVTAETAGSQTYTLGKAFTCTSPTLTAYLSKAGGLPSAFAGADASCNSGAYPMIVKECSLTFHPGPETGGKFPGTFDVTGCAGGGGWYIETGGAFTCNTHILPQSGLPAQYEIVGSGASAKVRFTPLVSNTLKYTVEGGVCKAGTTGTFENGSWSGGWDLKAVNSGGTQVGLSLSDPPGGFFTSASTGKFEAESYPLHVVAEDSATHVVELGNVGNVECAEVGFVADVPSATNTLDPVEAEYGNCVTSSTWQTTLSMRSCHYVFYSWFEWDIACTEPGDAVEIKIYKLGSSEVKCTALIGPQHLGGVEFTTVGEGRKRAVDVNFNTSGITYSTAGGLLNCGVKNGAHTEGNYTGSSQFKWWGYYE